jgi:hypothetical protein
MAGSLPVFGATPVERELQLQRLHVDLESWRRFQLMKGIPA